MFELISIDQVAEVIETAIAPVFLIAGIAGLLAVLTNRLGRIIDRARTLSRSEGRFTSSEHLSVIATEKRNLLARSRYINYAIACAAGGALSICLVIILLFIGTLIGDSLATVVMILFVLALALLAISLCSFLREIYVAATSMRASIAPSEEHFHEKIH